MRPLRIGIITDGLVERVDAGVPGIANGGVGTYIHQLVTHIQALPSSHELFLIRCGGGGLDLYRGARTRAVILPASPARRLVRWVDWPYRSLAERLGLDLLHYPNQFGGAFLPPAVRRVVTLHDVTPLDFPRFHTWRRAIGYRVLLRRSLDAADHVIVQTAHTRAEVIRRGFAPAEKVSAIALAAADRFRPTPPTEAFARRYDLPPRFILSVGVLEPRKNHALLLDALRRLHAAGERVGLVIAGREGWRWRNPLDDARAADLRPWVRVLCNLPDADLVECYNRAAVVALPTFSEGFGLPVLEAMACGTPVVASRAPALPEVGAGAARYADPHDPGDFAAHLLAVLRDTALRARLIEAGFARAREFSWRRTAEQTVAVYERVCAA